jgi:hypothetical protein
MNYHIARDGQQIGIFTREDVLARYQSGEIRGTDLAWCEGMAKWSPVSEVFGAPAVAAPPPAPVAAAPVPPAGVTPPAASSSSALPPKPNNYLVWSILATLLCCPLTGIPSIIFATQVDSKYSAGDFAGAQAASKNAKLWLWISVGVCLLGALVYCAFVGITILMSAHSY